MTSTDVSTETRELDLVGRVELRIALAKDDKLQAVLKTYLPPLLLKLASDHVSVRNKVSSLLTCWKMIVLIFSGDFDMSAYKDSSRWQRVSLTASCIA